MYFIVYRKSFGFFQIFFLLFIAAFIHIWSEKIVCVWVSVCVKKEGGKERENRRDNQFNHHLHIYRLICKFLKKIFFTHRCCCCYCVVSFRNLSFHGNGIPRNKTLNFLFFWMTFCAILPSYISYMFDDDDEKLEFMYVFMCCCSGKRNISLLPYTVCYTKLYIFTELNGCEELCMLVCVII